MLKPMKFGTASTELDNISKLAYNICFVEESIGIWLKIFHFKTSQNQLSLGLHQLN